MFNLAALRYRSVSTAQGGPIEKIEFSEFSVLGQRCYQANAFLNADLVQKRKSHDLYSNADGTGTHPTAIVARYMAISEAIERWAFHTKVRDYDHDLYGFDRDASSNGMAAFPGLCASQCRSRAYFEALERYSLVAWWDGSLWAQIRQTEWEGVTAVEIDHGLDTGCMVILYKYCSPGFYSYGHAAAKNFKVACRRAAIELCRNEYVLRCYRTTHPHTTINTLDEVDDIFERRCLFFSYPEGHKLFQEKIATPPEKERKAPDIIFDGQIRGPWSKYATVWRVAMEMPTNNYKDKSKLFFIW